MNNHQRAERLCEKAEHLGMDAPSEGMIADAIHDAEEDIRTEVESVLLKLGFYDAAKAVGRWSARNHLLDEQERIRNKG